MDGLAAVCRQGLREQPLSGTVLVFRNRAAPARNRLVSAGQGFWLWTKRRSQGRFHWWPPPEGARTRLAARALQILRWPGHPEQARRVAAGRPLAEGGARGAGEFPGSHASGAAKTWARGSGNATRDSRALTLAGRQVASQRVSPLAREALDSVF